MKYLYNILFLFLFFTCSFQGFGQLTVDIECPDTSDYCIDVGGSPHWYWYDNDGDGLGSVDSGGQCRPESSPPSGFADNCSDCNDTPGSGAGIGGPTAWYLDGDDDGLGAGPAEFSCNNPGGGQNWVQNNDDCNDGDENIGLATLWYYDDDGDGFGDPDIPQLSCTDPDGPTNNPNNWVENDDDCNDGDPTTTTLIFYRDFDGDTFGDPDITHNGCTPNIGYVTNSDDCNDLEADFNPNTEWYPDTDGDGYGDHNASPIIQCDQPLGQQHVYVFGEADCDDTNPLLHPGTIWYVDADNDGFADDPDDHQNGYIIQCEDPGPGFTLNIAPLDPIPEDPLPVYPNLNINDLTFLKTIEPLEEVDNLSDLNGLSSEEKIVSKTYFDGMGRPMQQIAVGHGGNQEDIISYIEYDRFGRTVKGYMPYGKNTNSPGAYNQEAKTEIESFYTAGSIHNSFVATDDPFSEAVFDRSPRGRTERQGSPGDSWKIGSGNEMEYDYLLNNANDVRMYKVNLSSNFQPSLAFDGSHYPANELAISIVKDQNWVSGTNHTSEEFKNKDGQVILTRSYENGVRFSTYYVYDTYNNLTYILPPKAEPETASITQTVLDELCYQYRYDALRRQTSKRIPGVSGWERVVYDHEDRPILVRDYNMQVKGEWLFTKYDKFGRVTYTGIYTPPANKSQEELQLDAESARNISGTHNEQRGSSVIGGVTIGYTNNAYPNDTNNMELLTVTYYDNYNFVDPDKPTTPTTIEGVSVTNNVIGVPVASWSRTIGETSWNKTYSYYDEKARVLQSINKNHLGGHTQIESEYDFRGKTLKATTKQKRLSSDSELTVTDRFIYDRVERVLGQYQKINNDTEKLINGFVYDATGQLLQKYIQPENEDFGYHWVNSSTLATRNSFSKQTTGNWEVNSKNGTQLIIDRQRLEASLTNTGTGINGYYELLGNKEYTISMDIDISSFNGELDFGIWQLGTQLYNETIIHSGEFVATFTPSSTGTYYLSFNMKSNANGNSQTFTLDNVLIQRDLSQGSWVAAIKPINALQEVNYKYNAVGNLTHINDPNALGDDLFGYKVNFDVVESSGIISSLHKPNFNGNISQVFWKTANDDILRDYIYAYDGLNRLTKATFSDTNYNLENVSYDKNGNITALKRNTETGNQDFTYGYDSGNKLTSLGGTIADGSGSNSVNRTYSYDGNGNMVTDSNKGISLIEYNYLNLPEKVTMDNGNWVEYEYDASGVKLQKRTFIDGNNATVDYINGFQYTQGTLSFFGQPEGYISYTLASGGNSETFEYVYNYTDHLDNVRLSYSDLNDDGIVDSSEIVNENNYYPFGLLHQGYNNAVTGPGTGYNYGYNGKELQFGGLDWLDFGSRNYDAELGRWFNTDPQAERYSSISPYAGIGNNPIIYTDPNGEELLTAIVAGALIGAWLGSATTAVTGGDFQDYGKNALIGGIAGALSGGVGFALSSSSSIAISGLQNTIVGASTGATGGLVSGTLGPALNNGDFGSIVGGGLIGTITGATVGGITGAAQDIMEDIRLNKMFNAEGKSNIPVNPDGSIDPSTEVLEKFSDDYFPDFKYRDNARLSYDNDFINMQDPSGVKQIRANTNPIKVNGKHDIRFGDRSFVSPKTLFRTMGHEYVHVSHFTLELPLGNRIYNTSEYGGYYYEELVEARASGGVGWNKYQNQANYRLGITRKLTNSEFRKLGVYRRYSEWGIPTKYPNFK